MTPERETEIRGYDLCQTSRELLAALDAERARTREVAERVAMNMSVAKYGPRPWSPVLERAVATEIAAILDRLVPETDLDRARSKVIEAAKAYRHERRTLVGADSLDASLKRAVVEAVDPLERAEKAR